MCFLLSTVGVSSCTAPYPGPGAVWGGLEGPCGSLQAKAFRVGDGNGQFHFELLPAPIWRQTDLVEASVRNGQPVKTKQADETEQSHFLLCCREGLWADTFSALSSLLHVSSSAASVRLHMLGQSWKRQVLVSPSSPTTRRSSCAAPRNLLCCSQEPSEGH